MSDIGGVKLDCKERREANSRLPKIVALDDGYSPIEPAAASSDDLALSSIGAGQEFVEAERQAVWPGRGTPPDHRLQAIAAQS
jgi:hypothetical protein